MEEDLAPKSRSDDKIKELILDESFKKAESKRIFHSRPGEDVKRQIKKRSISSIGVILILIAIVCLVIVNFGPWALIFFEADYGSDSVWIFKDTQASDINSQDVIDLFSSPNYIGITIEDFNSAAWSVTKGFISLIILGLIIIIFQIIDNMKDFSEEIFCVFVSVCASGVFLSSLYIILSTVKFIGSYLLIAENMSLFKIKAIVAFLIPILILVVSFIILKISYSFIKFYFREIERKKVITTTKHTFFKSGIGGDID